MGKECVECGVPVLDPEDTSGEDGLCFECLEEVELCFPVGEA